MISLGHFSVPRDEFESYANRTTCLINISRHFVFNFDHSAKKMASNGASSKTPTDFSAPWKFSDVVLVVEDQKFHVHRSTLAFWSPVFEKMFMSDFKEKSKDEISLPGKKASEIKQLLHMMYPSLEEKPVTKSNCYFLLELAHEYQIESIAQKCEAFMVTVVKAKQENDVIAMLIYGQKYHLKCLITTCIYEARLLTFNQLKEHKMRVEIGLDNYKQITEGIIQRLEATVAGHNRDAREVHRVKKEGLKKLENVSKNLYLHAERKKSQAAVNGPGQPPPRTPDDWLDRLRFDRHLSNTSCLSLDTIAAEVKYLKNLIENLP